MRLLKLMFFCCVNQEKYDSRNKYIPAQYSFEHYSALYFCLKLMHPNLQFSLKFVIKHVHCTCWNTGPIPVHCTCWNTGPITVHCTLEYRTYYCTLHMLEYRTYYCTLYMLEYRTYSRTLHMVFFKGDSC